MNRVYFKLSQLYISTLFLVGNEGDNKGKGGNIEANNDGESQDRKGK